MQAKVSNVLNACTLVGLGAVFLSFYWSGRIDQYLNPAFRPLVLVSGLLMVIIGVIRLFSHPVQHHVQMGIAITSTPNAGNPLAQGQTALLTCDVWEHAYYLDFQNRRPDFVQAFLDHLVNWDYVAELYGAAAK